MIHPARLLLHNPMRRIRQCCGLWLMLAGLIWPHGLCAAERPQCRDTAAEPVDFAALMPDLTMRLQDGAILQLAGLAPLYTLPQAQRDFAETFSATLKDRAVFAKISPQSDRWGRRTAFVLFEDEHQHLALLNSFILAQGFGRFKPDAEAAPCRSEMLKAESEARNSHKGLWADGTLSLYPADLPDIWHEAGASGLDGTFIIVEGQVRRSGLGAAHAFLDFGDKNTPNGFSVTILKKNLKSFEHEGMAPDKLTGHTLRVRGVLDMRFGPHMELTSPDAVERVD